MVEIEPFVVEQWMERYEPGTKFNIAETCVASISLEELQALSSKPNGPPPIDRSRKLTYGAIRGSNALREAIAAMYSTNMQVPLAAENILIMPGGIAANFLALYTLCGPGDHVICVYPTYQQLYELPKAAGAEVSLWRLKESNANVPDLADLESLLKPNTKMIIINNPNNPTGSTAPGSFLAQIVSLARSRNILLYADEVYNPLYHTLPANAPDPPQPIISFGSPNTISVGSMSKAFSLAGIRLGWLASPSAALIARLAAARDYTTISVSQLDDQVAAYALSADVLPALLERNMALARKNLKILQQFVEEHAEVCSWIKPSAGTTAFICVRRGGVPVDDAAFCADVHAKKGVLLCPGGRCFGTNGGEFRGFIRVGYACHTEELVGGLTALGDYLKEEF